MSEIPQGLELSGATVGRLPAGVRVPAYERPGVRPAIVHFGVGGFHRAHQAVYTDDVLAAGDLRWGIRGAGLTPADAGMREALAAQDFLYTVVAREPGFEETRVVGSIVDYLLAGDDPQPLVQAIADPSTRIVSLTITENGYRYRAETVDLDFAHPDVRNDVAGGPPLRTVYGFLRAALERVRRSGTRPPTVLSCDNLPQNGDRLRKLLLQFLERVDPGLGRFVERNVEFPNCMVDRITPVTTDEQRARLADRFGLVDRRPVFCERFRQWVIEDRFPAGRPDWSAAGATFVSDVVPFERMKIRLLNGSHSALGYVGFLLGHRRVDRAMADADVHAFVRSYMDEIAPTVGPVPGMDLGGYRDSLLERFANPAIADQVLRLAQDGSKKVPNMILEPLGELLAERRPCPFAAFALAAWIRFLEGSDESGGEIPLDDPLAPQLREAARATLGGDVSPFLALGPVFPPALAGDAGLRRAVGDALAAIRGLGTRAALRQLSAGS